MKKILIVDDDVTIAKMFQVLLQKKGFEVVVKDGGQAAIEFVKANPPDAVLCDINMPVISGLDVLRTVRNDPKTKNLPILIFTNRTDDEAVKEAKGLGASGFYIKSEENPHNLVEVVEGLLK